jgi:hypothetical protein
LRDFETLVEHIILNTLSFGWREKAYEAPLVGRSSSPVLRGVSLRAAPQG